MSKFKVGDRVRYVGNDTPSWRGKEGVIDISSPGMSKLTWDGGKKGFPDTKNLELVEPKLDLTKPLIMRSGLDQPVNLILVGADGEIMVEEPNSRAWIVFDKDGNFLRSAEGLWAGRELRNKQPDRQVHKKQVYVVGKDVRISNSESQPNLEIIVEDGKIVSMTVGDLK